MGSYPDATAKMINEVLFESWEAFKIYGKKSLKERAGLMRQVAKNLVEGSADLVQTAMEETNLPEPRLRSELTRTIFQLNSYADACERGEWLEVRIDTAIADRNPPRPDLRKMLVPLGTVAVFGASNFPFAYSTAGGDTACALAAGCPVVVKAHPAHAETSEMVAKAIKKAVKECGLPTGVFAHVHGTTETGKALVMHPHTKAVGFTGSFAGGKALFDWGNQREEPIPVFAEMGSVNPVYLLPQKLNEASAGIAKMYGASITLSVGQFCTNPGLIIGIDSLELDDFVDALGVEIRGTKPAKMLHNGIAKAFHEKRNAMLADKNVAEVAEAAELTNDMEGIPTIAETTGEAFLTNKQLHQEIFGPFSLLVRCKSIDEMLAVALQMEGQLTSTVMGTDEDLVNNEALIDAIKNKCGRLILNGVPTGVEVCLSMHHGGPFPSSTDSRFTSVGADGIKRFARPICFQNWSNHLLPDELKNENPLQIWRTVNDQLSQTAIFK